MSEESTGTSDPTRAEGWTATIRPKSGLLDLNLLEVWRYRDLIWLFVKRDFVAKYKQTILGPMWFIIQPLLTTVMFTVVFGKIAGIPTQGLPHILFYMSGIVFWNYFSVCLTSTSATFTNNASLFGKVYFPRLVLPISTVISALITFLIQFALLLAFIVFYVLEGLTIAVGSEALLIPFLVILVAGQALGFGILISSVTTKYRDLQNLMSFGVQLWMYATPIIFPLSEVPERYKSIVQLNPMTPIIESFRAVLFGVGRVDYWFLLYSALFTLAILAAGAVAFNRIEKNFLDTV